MNDMGEFYSYVNNKIVYFYSYLGVYDYCFYGVCEYDADWEHTVKKSYEVYNIDDPTEFDSKDFLSQFDWAKDVDRINCEEREVYYVIGTPTPDESYTKVLLEKDEWLKQFGNDIGMANMMERL